MSSYKFYYDESEHSRKINYKTISAENYSDSFVTVIVGWTSDYQSILCERYGKFEEKYKHRKSHGELKSSTIKQNQLLHGFASLNDENISMLGDFFDLFDDNIHVYYAIISKFEYIVRQLFIGYENRLFLDMDAIKYSITKALLLYHPSSILEGMYENTGELIPLLKDFFQKRIDDDRSNPELKRAEIEQFKQILKLLNDVSEVRTIDWNYSISFAGFKNYLAEKSIAEYSLAIDREGENHNTANAAEQIGLHNISEMDSCESFGIRMADMLAGIISKLIKALNNDLRYTSPEDFTQKKVLNKAWFKISTRQLMLYKKLFHIAVELNKAWYKAYAGNYSDDMIQFISLLAFMNHFSSPDEIMRDINMQNEYFNAYVCEQLSDHFEQMHNKLPLEPITRTGQDWFFNNQGAKVYYDSTKHQNLPLNKEKQVYHVLSVGQHKDGASMITIERKDTPICYRLPDELAGWAELLVSFANYDEKLLPADVLFTFQDGKYYADIL